MRYVQSVVRLTLLASSLLTGCASGDLDEGSTETDGDQVTIVRADRGSSEDKSLSASFVATKVSFTELVADYPAESAARVDPGSLKADAIVGWYDKGHNYHKEHMKAVTDFGDVVINPGAFRGVGL